MNIRENISTETNVAENILPENGISSKDVLVFQRAFLTAEERKG